MKEGILITKRVTLPLPNDPSIDEDFLRKHAEQWVENTFGIGDYFCRTSAVDPDYYKLVNYQINVDDMFADNKHFLTNVVVTMTFKQLDCIAFIDNLGR